VLTIFNQYFYFCHAMWQICPFRDAMLPAWLSIKSKIIRRLSLHDGVFSGQHCLRFAVMK
jgi:hypothetical protein